MNLLTENLDDTQRRILGMMPWETGPIAQALRLVERMPIPADPKEEQAVVIHWLLKMYAEHGDRWKRVAEALLAPAFPQVKPIPPPPARSRNSSIGTFDDKPHFGVRKKT